MSRSVSRSLPSPGEAVPGMDPYVMSDRERQMLRSLFRRNSRPAITSEPSPATLLTSARALLSGSRTLAARVPRRVALGVGVGLSAGLVIAVLGVFFKRKTLHLVAAKKKKGAPKPIGSAAAAASAARAAGSAGTATKGASAKSPKKTQPAANPR